MMVLKACAIILCCILPAVSFSQNLTGTWEGSGGGTTYIKMVVRHRGDSVIGYTYDEGNGFCKALFLGFYDESAKRLTGRGTKMLEHTSNHVLVNYDLIYSRQDRGEF